MTPANFRLSPRERIGGAEIYLTLVVFVVFVFSAEMPRAQPVEMETAAMRATQATTRRIDFFITNAPGRG